MTPGIFNIFTILKIQLNDKLTLYLSFWVGCWHGDAAVYPYKSMRMLHYSQIQNERVSWQVFTVN